MIAAVTISHRHTSLRFWSDAVDAEVGIYRRHGVIGWRGIGSDSVDRRCIRHDRSVGSWLCIV